MKYYEISEIVRRMLDKKGELHIDALTAENIIISIKLMEDILSHYEDSEEISRNLFQDLHIALEEMKKK